MTLHAPAPSQKQRAQLSLVQKSTGATLTPAAPLSRPNLGPAVRHPQSSTSGKDLARANLKPQRQLHVFSLCKSLAVTVASSAKDKHAGSMLVSSSSRRRSAHSANLTTAPTAPAASLSWQHARRHFRGSMLACSSSRGTAPTRPKRCCAGSAPPSSSQRTPPHVATAAHFPRQRPSETPKLRNSETPKNDACFPSRHSLPVSPDAPRRRHVRAAAPLVVLRRFITALVLPCTRNRARWAGALPSVGAVSVAPQKHGQLKTTRNRARWAGGPAAPTGTLRWLRGRLRPGGRGAAAAPVSAGEACVTQGVSLRACGSRTT
jgi:hypothetical protein